MTLAGLELARLGRGRALDIGCGAGRNAVPLAAAGWDVLGIDLSMPMLMAAAARAHDGQVASRHRVARGSMAWLPVPGRSCDLVVAHGIWNLARTDRQFRAAIQESSRVAKNHAALFVFTFSRSTLPAGAQPVPGESRVFAGVSGEPQVFLTKQQLLDDLGAAGFAPDPSLPIEELNPRRQGMLAAAGSPVIWQGGFRLESAG
jgi:SAM-dependent methyltransferase